MYVNDEEKKYAAYLTQELRMAGFIVETEYTGRGLKGQFKQADRLKAKFTCVLNSEDLDNHEVKIKNNKTKEEQIISLDLLIYFLEEMINSGSEDECDCGCDHEHCHCDENCECGCQDGGECTCGEECHCDESCECGCQDGGECTCGEECHCDESCECGCQDGGECTCNGECHCGDKKCTCGE